METCNVLLTICGRNRVTTRAQPIACLTLPLAGYAKMVKPDWYPLAYKILLPSGYDVAEERESFRGSRSWEQKGRCFRIKHSCVFLLFFIFYFFFYFFFPTQVSGTNHRVNWSKTNEISDFFRYSLRIVLEV